MTCVPLLVLHPHEEVVPGDAGVVDQDVEARRARPRPPAPAPRRRPGRTRFAGDARGRARPSSAASASSAPARVPDSATVAPWRVQRPGDGAAEAAGGAGDEGLLPVRSNMRTSSVIRLVREGGDVVGRADGATPRRLGRDALDEAGQDLAGAELVERVDARRRHGRDALAPAHRAGDLRDQRSGGSRPDR